MNMNILTSIVYSVVLTQPSFSASIHPRQRLQNNQYDPENIRDSYDRDRAQLEEFESENGDESEESESEESESEEPTAHRETGREIWDLLLAANSEEGPSQNGEYGSVQLKPSTEVEFPEDWADIWDIQGTYYPLNYTWRMYNPFNEDSFHEASNCFDVSVYISAAEDIGKVIDDSGAVPYSGTSLMVTKTGIMQTFDALWDSGSRPTISHFFRTVTSVRDRRELDNLFLICDNDDSNVDVFELPESGLTLHANDPRFFRLLELDVFEMPKEMYLEDSRIFKGNLRNFEIRVFMSPNYDFLRDGDDGGGSGASHWRMLYRYY